MEIKAAAKINLLLDVSELLPNGLHSLFTVMQSVSLYDTVRLRRTGTGKISVSSDDERVPAGDGNIASRAARVFFDCCEIGDRGIEIEIEKKIPISAGLAGGSADAAAVLYGLNKLYGTRLKPSALRGLGGQVGADVPFALTGGTALCLNTGDVIAPLPPLDGCFFVLCKPPSEVSTAAAYRAVDETGRIRHADRSGMLFAMANRDYELMCQKVCNVFEQAVEVPKRPYIKSILRECGAQAALMSGSGPTVFGVFRSRTDAERAHDRLRAEFSETCLALPTVRGTEEA